MSNAVLHLYNTNYHVVYTLYVMVAVQCRCVCLLTRSGGGGGGGRCRVKDHRQDILDRLQRHGSQQQ